MANTDNEQSGGQRRDARRTIPPILPDPSRQYESGRWGTFLSLLALVLSAISVYQTVLKQPRPTVYMSGFIRLGHDRSRNELFALPVTIVNHGPRDTVVTSLTLGVLRNGSGNRMAFVSSYFGDKPQPTDRLFTPISVAGHSSFAGSIVFARNGQKDRADIQGRVVHEFCLSIRTETGDEIGILSALLTFQPSALSFQAETPILDDTQLAAGQDVSLPVQNIKRIADADKSTNLPACE